LGKPTERLIRLGDERNAERDEGRRTERRHATAEHVVSTGGIIEEQLVDAELPTEYVLGQCGQADSQGDHSENLGESI